MRQQPFASPEEALQHYGVKGMRWGVRKKDETAGRDAAKGRIAPLVKGTKDAAPKTVSPSGLSPKQQARVDKFLQRSDIVETRISEIKLSNEALQGTRNPIKLYERKINNDAVKQMEKQQKKAVRDAEAVQKGKLTSKQKKVIFGALAVTAVVGVSYAASKGGQSGAFNSWRLMAQARLSGSKVPFTVNKDLAKPMSAADLLTNVAKPVNPGYSLPGGKMNCRRSTYAYELRRRGFDVHATTSAVGWGQSESGVINALTTEGRDYFRSTSMSETVVKTGFSSVAKGDKRVPPGAKILLDNLMDEKDMFGGSLSSSKKVLEELGKQPNGARGEVLFKFAGFGHSMAYEVVNGVPKIFDSQKGTMYDAKKKVESKWDGFSAAEIRRLDDLDLDLNFLSRWATNN